MRKIIFLILIVIISIQATTISESGNTIYIKGEAKDIKGEVFNTTLASLENLTISKSFIQDSRGEFKRNLERDGVTIKPFTFREMKGYTLSANTPLNEGEEIVLELTKEDKGRGDTPIGISPVFLPAYQKLADNFSTSYLSSLDLNDPKMLILGKESSEELLVPFIEWKRMKGIETNFVSIESLGISEPEEIKSYVASQYNDYETRPDFLLIIGDVDYNSAYQFPAFYYGPENNVSDLPYTLVEGDDYFPEILAGRFSVDTTQELATVIKKIFYYEKEPYMDNPEWFKKALMVAGNHSSTQPIPTTPVKVSMWMRDKMLDYGYDQVDELYYWPPAGYYHNNPEEVANSINEGVSAVSYRGWGNSTGWEYPEFKVTHMNLLNNGRYLPFVTSIVCDTGDFAHSNDPCFAEALLRAGTPSQPKGAVIVTGPSDLDTNTKYNNSIFSGFYSGMLDDDIHGFSTLLLLGKIELYKNFPLELDEGARIEYNFYIYNTLGDPSLTLWSDTPEEVSFSSDNTLPIGGDYLDIECGIDNGVLTIVDNSGNLIHTQTVMSSDQFITFPPQTEPFTLTITKDNYQPLIKNIDVTGGAKPSVESATFVDGLNIGAMEDIEIVIKNHGSSTISGLTAELESLNPYTTINSDDLNIGDLEPNGSKTVTANIVVDDGFVVGGDLDLKLSYSNGETSKFSIYSSPLRVAYLAYDVDDSNGVLDPGETSTLNFTLKNLGEEIGSLTTTIHSMNSAITISNPSSSHSGIESGDDFVVDCDITADGSAWSGKRVKVQLVFEDERGIKSHLYTYITIGTGDNSSPTGPDNYGYYGYDSSDTAYPHAPTYEWIELDPQLGGDGEVVLLSDDENHNIDLPFGVNYYGAIYNSITICSNGWISFKQTEHTNFRNWSIPAILGPYGMISPYWDDLIGKKVGSTHEDMRVVYKHDSSNQRFIIEWNEAYSNFDDQSLQKFQIVILDPSISTGVNGESDIIFNYHTVSNPDQSSNYATVGIENYNQNDGVLYTYANIYESGATPLSDGISIKFTTAKPDNFVNIDESSPETTQLLGCYPNPFNPDTTLKFQLSEGGSIAVKIYNSNGEMVRDLINGSFETGTHSISWDGKDGKGSSLSSGVYTIQMVVDGRGFTTRALLIK
jgi:hypothetical protein